MRNDRSHAYRLAAGEQQKREEGHQRNDEKQDERAIDKNLGDQNGEGAGDHHDSDKGEALLDADGPAPAQELNGKHGRQEGKVPAEHLAEREAHGGGKGDPEGERMALAGICRPLPARVAALTDIGQDRYKPYPERSDGVHDGIVGRIDDDVCLRAIAHAARDIILAIGFDLDGEALRIANQSHRLIDLRQARFGIDRSLRYAPADALHFGGENAPGKRVEHKLHRIARLDILQAVLAKIGVDPDVAGIDESQRRLTGGNKFAVR